MEPDRPSDLTECIEHVLARPRWSAGVCVAATLVGLTLSLIAWQSVPPINPDSTAFMQGARSLVRNGTYTTVDGYPLLVFPPGYSALIALLIPVTGSAELAGRLISLILSTAGIPLLFPLVRGLGSRLLATGSMLLFALLPERVEHSVTIGTDGPFLFLVLLLLVLTHRWLSAHHLRWATLIGVTAAVAYLVRPEGAIMLAVVLAAALVASRFSTRVVLGSVAAALVFCVGIWPYVHYLKQQIGRWELSAKSRVNLAIADDVSSGRGWKRFLTVDASGRVIQTPPADSPSRLLRRAAYNAGRIFARLARFVTPVPFMLAGLGLASIVLSRRYRPLPPASLCFLSVLAVPLVYIPVFFIESRFVIQPMILVLILGAAGAIHLWDLIDASRRMRAAVVIAGILVATMVAYNAPNFEGPGMAAFEEEQAQADWIAQHSPEARALVGRQWYLAYRAELAHLQLPYSPVERVAEYARTYGASLLLLPKSDAHPELCTLALHPKSVHGLIPIRDLGDAVVFQLADGDVAGRPHVDDATARIWTRCR